MMCITGPKFSCLEKADQRKSNRIGCQRYIMHHLSHELDSHECAARDMVI